MTADKNVPFVRSDWDLLWDHMHDNPQWLSDYDALRDEMGAYEKALFLSQRGYRVQIPDRTCVTLRIAQIENQSKAGPAE